MIPIVAYLLMKMLMLKELEEMIDSEMNMIIY